VFFNPAVVEISGSPDLVVALLDWKQISQQEIKLTVNPLKDLENLHNTCTPKAPN
jgi:hypothetical protein